MINQFNVIGKDFIQEVSNYKITRSSNIFRPKLKQQIGLNYGDSIKSVIKNPNILLLVSPYSRIKKESNESPVGRIEEMKRIGVPIGLLRIATKLKNKYSVKIMDCAAEGFNNEKEIIPEIGLYRYGLDDTEILDKIKEIKPNIIGITVDYTHQWGNARHLVDLIKDFDASIIVILGGAHVTGDYLNAISDCSADYIVMCEGDIIIDNLLDALTNKKDLSKVNGIVYKESNKIIITPKQSFIPDIDSLGVLDYSLIDLKLYSGSTHSAGQRKNKEGYCAYLSTTIGCNTRCLFCTIPLVNGPFRRFSLNTLDKQLTQLSNLGVTEILIEDDNLLYDPMWTLEVCNLFKKHKVSWMEEGGISLYSLIALYLGKNAVDIIGKEFNEPHYRLIKQAIDEGITIEQIIKEMADSGCYSVYLAIESSSEDCLIASGKPKINSYQHITLDIIKLFKKYNIKVIGGFMIGFCMNEFTESKEDILETTKYAKFLVDNGMDFANPFIVTPLPGTPMGEYQMQFSVRDYDTGYSHELGTFDIPNSYTAKEVEILRWNLLIMANSREKVNKILETGTWPV